MGLRDLTNKDGQPGAGKQIRAWLPDAESVRVLDAHSGKALGELTRSGDSALFERTFPVEKPVSLCPEVKYPNSEKRFSSSTLSVPGRGISSGSLCRHSTREPLPATGRSTPVLFGRHRPDGAGVRFAVFRTERFFSQPDQGISTIGMVGATRWKKPGVAIALLVPDMETGARYKYEIKDAEGNWLPHKADPLGFSAEQYPSHASKVFDHHQYEWHDAQWQAAQARVNRRKPHEHL